MHFYIENMVSNKHWDFYSRLYNPVLKIMAKERSVLYRNLALDLQQPLNIYVAGCGTGLDFPYLPPQSYVHAVDFAEQMLLRAQKTADKLQLNTQLKQARAEHSGLADNSQDLVILHLILAVTNQPQQLLDEAVRVLKPNGIISVWDKFLPDGNQPTLMRNLVNSFTTKKATAINLQIEPLLSNLPLRIIHREFSLAGLMQHIVLQKQEKSL